MLAALKSLLDTFGMKGAVLVLGLLTGYGFARAEQTEHNVNVNTRRLEVLESERVDVAKLTVQLEATNSSVSSLQLQLSDLKNDIRELRVELQQRRAAR